MYDIVIVGGGLVGASFALDLIKKNSSLNIAIIDRFAPDFSQNEVGFDNKIYAISPRNYEHLIGLGVNLNQDKIGVIDAMKVRGNAESKIEFSKQDCKNNYLAKIIEYRNLLKAVYDQLEQFSNVQFIYTSLKKIEQLHESVRLIDSHDEVIEATWLVGADGANSFVRNHLNIEVESIAYYQAGLVANFECEISHQNTAQQWFIGEGVLAYLPLPNNQISIVWSCDNTQELLNLSDQELCEAVSRAGQNSLGKLKLITKPMAFPLKLNLVNKFYQNRIILIGDAAHTIHPLAGQGVNLGFGDAWKLAAIMAEIKIFDINKLARYNYSRLAEVRKMQMTCHLLHRLFHNRSWIVNKVRNLGLNLVNQLGILKKALIDSAINY